MRAPVTSHQALKLTGRVPVVTDTHAQIPSTPNAPTTPVDQFANAPVVEDDIGALSTLPATALPASPPPSASTPAATGNDLQFFSTSSDPQSTTTDTTSSDGSGTSITSGGSQDVTSPAPPEQQQTVVVGTNDTGTVSNVTPATGTGSTTEVATTGDSGAVDPSVVTPPSSDTSSVGVAGTTSTGGTGVDATGTDPNAQGATGATAAGCASSGSTGGTSAGTTPSTQSDGATQQPASSDSTTPDPTTCTASGLAPPAAWNVNAADGSSHTISAAVSGTEISVTIDGTSQSQAISSVSSLTVTSGDGNDSFTIDASLGSTGIPIAFDGGAGVNTLNGPSSDTTWTVTGANSGTAAGVAFSNFQNLTGAANNKDTFDVQRGASVSGVVDGGPGGYDTLAVTATAVVSTPTGTQSGIVVADGSTITYAGLEPVDLTASSVTVNGRDSSGDLKKDLMKVSLSGPQIVIDDYDPTGTVNLDTLALSEHQVFTIAGTTSVTINGGAGIDTVEFLAADYELSGISLTVNAETIKVDDGTTLNLGAGDLAFNAALVDDGFSLLGITTTGLPDDATIDLNNATIVAHNVSLTASSGTLKTSVSGAQTLSNGGNITVASTDGFDSSGSFTIGSSTCTYTATDGTHFQNLSGCNGVSATDGSAVKKDINQTGAAHGINYSGVQLIYDAKVDIHGTTTITAGGNVTVSSTVDVTATAAANGTLGNWVSGNSYAKDDVVVDTSDSNKHYKATNAVTSDTTAPHSDSANWELVDSKDSSIAATVLVASALSRLTDTSSIAATSGTVNISSSMTTNVTTTADSSLSGSGAGIAVGIVVTDSEAYVDSTNSKPVHATSLTVSADTNDASPTSGKASPGGTESDSSDTTGKTNANDPTSADSTVGVDTSAAGSDAGAANNKSKTSDGNENFAAALAVTVLDATTKGYIDPNGDGTNDHTVDVGTGAVVVHAGATVSGSALADAGNVKFTPDAPTLALNGGGALTDGTTYYYEVSALYAGDGSTTVSGGSQNLAGGTLTVNSLSPFDSGGGVVKVGGGSTYCHYSGVSGSQLTGISGCTGTFTTGDAVAPMDESAPSAEASKAADSTHGTIGLSWTGVPNALAYGVYQSSDSGSETLLQFSTATTASDNGSVTPTDVKASDVTDKTSGVGIAVAVNVVVQTTSAYVGGRLTLTAGSTTVETTAPNPSVSSAHATSGAGGSSVGVAGSIAVNVASANTTSDVETTTNPVTLNGDLALTAAANLTSSAVADAVQTASGDTVGIGASFALDVVNDTVTAGIPSNSQISGAHNLTITSTDTDSASTEADGGASSGSGSAAISAEVAITISNVTTTASVADGNDLTLMGTGTLTAHATQTASTKTIAKGSTKGGTAGIGLSLALLFTDHEVYSQLLRNLIAGGNVSFTADGSSSNDTEATASSAGAKGKTSDSSKPDQTKDDSGKDVNQKADANLSSASSDDTSGKSSSKSTPSASSGENGGTKVTVAAAAAIALVTATAEASLEKDVTTPGSVTLASSEDTDSTAKANGSATKGTTANIGAAVAINLVKITNEAIVDTDVIVNSFGLTLTAAMRTTGGADGKHTIDTESTAGAGSGKLGIAGSLALTILTITTTAEVKSNLSRGPPAADNLHGHDLTLSATASVSSTAKAMAKDTDAGTVGIGAGAAINIVGDTTTASLDDGAIFLTTTGNTPGNVSLSATDTDAQTTYAEAGATAGANSDLSLSADAAIALPTVTTSATIAGGTSQHLKAAGKVTLSATQTASATTTAKGNAAGGTAAIGLALALAVPDDEVTASISLTVDGSTAVSLTASGSSATVTEADASAAGANGKDSSTKSTDSSGKDVNGKADDQLKSANTEAGDNGGTSSKTTDTSSAQATTSDSNGTGKSSSDGGNTVTVAGAAAINVATTISKAFFADTANVTSSGQVTLKAMANTDASAAGDGSATEAGTVGIGVGVAVNKADITNIATTGNSTIVSNGIDLEATMRVNGTDHLQRFDGTDWTTVDSGPTFPESPSDGDFFQITNAVPATTTVDGGQQLDTSNTTLTVKSTADFGPSGSFTISGVDGTCTYTSKDSTHLNGVAGCTVSSADKDKIDKVTVTETTTTKVSSPNTTVTGAQTLGSGNLTVGSTTGFFNGVGTFTVTGVTGKCSYSGTTGTTLNSVTGCTGSVTGGTIVTAGQDVSHGTLVVASTSDLSPTGMFTAAGVTGTCSYTGNDTGTHTLSGITGCTGTATEAGAATPVAKAPGVYKWDDASKSWQLQTAGIPSGTSFPTSQAPNDYFQATKAATAAVNGAQTLSSGGNLTVASTAGFNASGTITIGSSTCSYTSTTTTAFQNLSGAGCTGSVADKASVSGGLAAGIYKWNGTSWTVQGDGSTLPATAASGDYYRLAQDEIYATAKSGAGGDKDKVSIAGALALNIVSNDTEAIIPTPAHVTITSSTGNVTLKTLSNEEDKTNGDSNAKSGKVGIGASAAINVLTGNVTRSAIEDTSAFSCTTSCGALTISATSRHVVGTEDTAGATGGDAIAPSVSIAIVEDQTSAHLGTGADVTFTGAATIQASEELDSELKSDASAGGDSVAVGASVAVDYINPTTTADVARNLTASAITISSSMTTSSQATAKASAGGEGDKDSKGDTSKSADQQSSDQVGNDPNTSGKTPTQDSSKSTPQAGDSTSQANTQTSDNTGDSDSGGVGVAAAVAVNWVISHNTASVVSGVHLSSSGDILVSAVNQTTANAFALGYSGDTNLSSDTAIGAAVGLNVANVTNTAVVHSNANVRSTGGNITVEAVAPASKKNEFIVWAVAAAASKNDVSVAASIAVQVLLVHTNAYIEAGVTLDTPDNITVHAQTPIGLLDLAVSGGFSESGTAVGGAIAVNVLDPIDTEAYIDSGTVSNITHVDAGGALLVKAEASLDPLAPQLPSSASRLQGLVPQVSSVAIGGSAGGGSDPAVTGSVIVDVYTLKTNAEIKPGVHVNDTRQPVSGQSVEVTAQDDTHVINVAGAVALSSEGAGVAVSIVVDVIDKTITASIDDSAHVYAGGTVTVQALSTEQLFELAVGGGASGSSAAVTGSFVVVVLGEAAGTGTKAWIGDANVTSIGQTHVKASDSADQLQLYAGGITISGSSAGVGVSLDLLIRQGTVDAHVSGGAQLTVGSLLLEAVQNGNLQLVTAAGAGGSSAGIAGSVIVDVFTDNTTATLDGTTNASGTVAVEATDTTNVLGVAGSLSIGGDAGVGVGTDIEVITKTTQALIAPTADVTTTSGGDVTVDATSAETVLSIAAGIAVGGTAGVAVNATVSVYNITTTATIGDGGTIGTFAQVDADGTVRVAADEMLTLNIIAGNVAVGGTAGVGVAASVPVLTKTTTAKIGSYAQVTGKGNGGGLTVETGQYTVTATDNRFNGANVSGNTINTGIDLGFQTGDTVTYDPGDGTAIGGLATGTLYYVIRVDATHVELADSKANAQANDPLTIHPGTGESHRLIGTNQAQQPNDKSPRFDPSTNDVTGNTINLPYTLTLSTGDPVVYGAGGGTPIGGLTDGATYYVIAEGGNSYELAATADDAHANNPITLNKALATGKSHSLVKQGSMPSSDVNNSAPHTVSAGTSTGFRGVAVTATNSDDVNAVGVSVGGGEVGVSVSGTVDIVTVNTKATVDNNASVNSDSTGVNAGQSVLVAAGNQFHMLLVSASLAVGEVGVGAGVNVAVLNIHADALINDHATVNANKDVVTSATQQETIVAVTFAGAGGFVGVSGAVGVIVLNTEASAKTGAQVHITAGNNIGFIANDSTNVTGITGGVAGGFVGVGVGVYVLDLTKNTTATIASTSSATAHANTTDGLGGISDGTVSDTGFGFASFRGVAIQAQSSETIFGLVVSIGGGFVGVSVPVGVTLINVTTQATLAGSVTSDRDVTISALDHMKTTTVSGGIAGGFVGVGAGVDIGVANASTAALIASTGVVTTARNVSVNALAIKNITTYTFAVGGGFVGVGGAVAIWSAGTTSTSSYNDGQGDTGNARDEGGVTGDPWQSGHDYLQNDHASVGGQSYIAKVDHPNSSESPDTNSAQWELAQPSDPASAADSQTSDSSGNGYTSILSHSSTSASPWAMDTDYANGTSVTYGGHTYVATVDHPDQTESPDANLSDWRLADTDSHFNAMLSTHTSNASATIDANKAGSPTTSALAATPVNPGTSAEIFGKVTSTGDVTVNGDDNLHFGGIVGSAAGGFVGVGASLLVATLDAETTAELGGTGEITAGGAVTIHASLQENTSTLAFAGATGAAGVAAQLSVFRDSSTQWAKIDDNAKIHQALGGVDVKAETNGRSVTALTIGGSFGGVAQGVAIGIVQLTGSTKATVGTATIGDTGTVTSFTVEAHDASTAHAEAIAAAAGIGGAQAGAVAIATASPSVTATSDANVKTTGDVLVESTATSTAHAEGYGLAVGAGISIGVAVADSNAKPTLTTSLAGTTDAGGNVTVQSLLDTDGTNPIGNTGAISEAKAGSGGLLAGDGAVASADSSSTVSTSLAGSTTAAGTITVDGKTASPASSDVQGLALGAIGIGASVATATSSGSNLVDASGTLTGSAIDVDAESADTAYAHTFAGAGGILAGSGSISTATVSPTVSATIDPSAVVTAVTITLQTTGTGEFLPGSATNGSYFVIETPAKIYQWSGSSWIAQAGLESATLPSSGATLPGTGTLGSYFLLTATQGTNNPGYYTWNGSSWLFAVVPTAIVVVTSGDGNRDYYQRSGSSYVLFAPSEVTAGPTDPTPTDALPGSAATGAYDAILQPKVYQRSGSTWSFLSGVTTGMTLPSTFTDGTIVSVGTGGAYSTGVYRLGHGAVTVSATATPSATAHSEGIDGGALAVGVDKGTAAVSPTVTASVGHNVQMIAGSLTVQAQQLLPASGTNSDANATGAVGGLVGVVATTTEASSGAQVSAHVDHDAQLTVDGATTVSASNNSRSSAVSSNFAGGLIAAGASFSNAHSNTSSTAYLGDNVHLTGASLTVAAAGQDDNYAEATVGSGGVAAGAAAFPQTTNTSTTTAELGTPGSSTGGDHITLSGTLILTAQHTSVFNTKVITTAGGVLAGSGAEADNTVHSSVYATVAPSVVVTAGGIAIGATNDAERPPLGNPLSPDNNIKGDTGGLASGAGATSTTTLYLNTVIEVNTGADLEVQGAASSNDVFVLSALNTINVLDQMAFFTAGAISGAAADGTIQTTTDLAKVQIDSGATLISPGNLDLSARGGGSAIEHVGAQTYGAATGTVGSAEVNIHPENDIYVDGHLRALGNLNLTAGRSVDPSAVDANDAWTIDSRWDGYAGSAIPLSDVNASAFLVQSNNITVDSGANLETARQANLYAAQFSSATLHAKAQTVSWVSEVGDAISNLFGGLGEAAYSGNELQDAHGIVTVNGAIHTGLDRQVQLTLGVNGAGDVVATSVSDGISYSVQTAPLQSSLVVELQEDEATYAQYACDSASPPNSTLCGYYSSEITRLQTELAPLAEYDPNHPGDLNYATFPSRDVEVVIVNPIWVQAGVVDVRSDVLQGTGTFDTPSDPSVTITNNSPGFVELLGITIPDVNGGLFFDGTLMTTTGQVATLNGQNVEADNSLDHYGVDGNVTPGTTTFVVPTPGGTNSPLVDVENLLTTLPNDDPFPDITVLGTNDGGTGILNPKGTVKLKTSGFGGTGGNIYSFGPIVAANIDIEAAGNLYVDLSGTANSKFPVGGEPADVFGPATNGTYGAGSATADGVTSACNTNVTVGSISFCYATDTSNLKTSFLNELGAAAGTALYGERVTIKADWIDINGIVQSGRDTYALTLDSTVQNEITQVLNNGQRGTKIPLPITTAANPGFAVYYDSTVPGGRIVVDKVDVTGGFVELDGHVTSTTEAGQIKVLGGYGTISITNTTSYDVALNGLDASQPGTGTLLINDSAYGTPDATHAAATCNQAASPYTSLYQETNGTISLKTNCGNGETDTTVGASSVYDPHTGLRYGWTTVVSEDVIKNKHVDSGAFLGIIPTGTDITNWDSVQVLGQPFYAGSGPYYYSGGSEDTYDFLQETFTLSSTGVQTVNHGDYWTWYGVHHYWADYQEIDHNEVYFTHSVRADYPVAVDFIGNTTGTITVTSTNGGRILLDGQVLNPTGTTTLTTNAAIVNMGGALVTGKTINLSAGTGIGTSAIPINTDAGTTSSGAKLSASTTSGDIYLNEISGDMPVGNVSANGGGNVNLVADGGIVPALGVGNGVIRGGIVTLRRRRPASARARARRCSWTWATTSPARSASAT